MKIFSNHVFRSVQSENFGA
ncbi:hypothetical protein [Porphyromonas gingivalis]